LTAQITLPLRHGGLDLARTGPAEGRAAYLAAAAATHRAMLEGPTAFRPFDGPGRVELRAQWEALHDGAGDLWPPEVRNVNPDNLGVTADAQSTCSRHTAAAKFTTLLESFDAHSNDGRSARARLLSCACRPASAWLDTLPLTRTLSQEWRSQDQPPPPPWPQHDASKRTLAPVLLWGGPEWQHRRPCHAMLVPRSPDNVAPRYP
jgi:hypothetical protein